MLASNTEHRNLINQISCKDISSNIKININGEVLEINSSTNSAILTIVSR